MDMRKQFILSIVTLFFISNGWAESSHCIATLKQINNDYIKYGNSITSHDLSWMKVAWLENNLGHPKVAKNELNQIQYTWKCNSNDFMVAQISADHAKINNLNGQISSDEGAQAFNIDLPVPSIPQNGLPNQATSSTTNKDYTVVEVTEGPMTITYPNGTTKTIQPKPGKAPMLQKVEIQPIKPIVIKESPQMEEEGTKEDIADYNKTFNTSFKNEEELKVDAKKRADAFLTKLKSCIPGDYTFFQGAVLTSTIKGKQGDVCLVDISMSLAGVGVYSLSCAFQPQNLLDYIKSCEYGSFLSPKSPPVKKDCKITKTGMLNDPHMDFDF